MIYEALKYNFFSVEELLSFDPQTKEYKKALGNLIASCSFAALQDFKYADPDSEEYGFRKKYRKYFKMVVFFLVLSVIATLLMVFIEGDDQVQKFTPEETKAFLFWMGAMFLPLALGMIFAFKARGVIGQYIQRSLSTFHPNIQGITEDVLSEIIMARDDDFSSGDRAGCYSCLEIFETNRLTVDGGCPHCAHDTIVVDHGEYELNTDFLKKAKQYWLS